MSFRHNSRGLLAPAAGLALAAACNSYTPLRPGLSSFQVTATDLKGNLGTFPTHAIPVALTMTAIDKNGNPDTTFQGFAAISCTPGLISVGLGQDGSQAPATDPSMDPIVQFTNGQAQAQVWASQIYGETVFWVENRSAPDGGGAPGDDISATGVSNPLVYAYPLLQDTQVTQYNPSSPLAGAYVIFDESKQRCLSPPGDGGACDPGQLYTMDLIVSGVASDHFTVLDLNEYNPDSGLPNLGVNPFSGTYNEPGNWAAMYVYTYDEPTLFVGDRLTLLQGTLQDFDGDTQLNFPSYVLNPDSRYSLPQPQDLPPPVPINPAWCPPRATGDEPSDNLLCEDSTSDVHLESLESSLVSLTNTTMPSRWIDCDLAGTGEIPYRPAAGCMPETTGNFCTSGAGDGGVDDGGCFAGQDCVANECLTQCQSSSDCSVSDSEQCIDGHCQNACMCRQYCDMLPDCSELYDYDTYGQYNVLFPGLDGGAYKLGVISKTGVSSFNPYTSPGMVVDFTNGILVQSRASDPMWIIQPRMLQDMCCHSGSPGCDGDAGIAVCPQPTSQ